MFEQGRLLLYSSILFSVLTAPLIATEFYDDRKISNIEIIMDSETGQGDSTSVLSRMKTQPGDRFSQVIFDNDLKSLSEEFEKVEPSILMKDGKLAIVIHVTPRPIIHQIIWVGNNQFRTSTLQEELDIKTNTVFNRQKFNKNFNKVKEYYFKKGYFESQLSYSLEQVPGTNEVDVVIEIHEGSPGYIKEITITGLTKKEKSAIEEQMYLKKYNFLTSWLTGSGIYRDEGLEQDRMAIINYLQDLGYADAEVNINRYEDPQSGKLIIQIDVNKGVIYRFGKITFEGNSLISTGELEKRAIASPGSTYSPEKMRETAQVIKDLYGQKGYIDTSVQFEATLSECEPIFDVDYVIEEGKPYKIGIIQMFGNTSTKCNVILRESLLVPGETFDSRKLKATQQRLEAIGYFKSVNVYAVRNPDEDENYRDVYIEVEETSTGNVSLFMGLSSVDSIFGGLDLTERNFCISGVGNALLGKLSCLRGGGEYFHVRGTVGKKESNILVSWMNPYVNDTLWRLGVEVSQTYSTLQNDVTVRTYGGSVYTNYPLSQYWTAGVRQRLRHSFDHLDLGTWGESNSISEESLDKQRELIDQQGLVSAFSGNISYDSTDRPFKPTRGWRSYLEGEVAGVGGNYQFFKASYINSIYVPICRKGTLKFRGDFKYMIPFGKTDREHIPYSERFFLGGDNTVRGYKPFLLGPVIHLRDDNGKLHATSTPKGGLSSSLVSLEYNHEIVRVLDLFVFVDVGSVSFDSFAVTDIRPTTGFGARIDIGNRTPIMVGWGIPLIREDRHNHKWQRVFFSMGGTF